MQRFPLKAGLKILISPSNCQFNSKYWIGPDEADAFLINSCAAIILPVGALEAYLIYLALDVIWLSTSMGDLMVTNVALPGEALQS